MNRPVLFGGSAPKPPGFNAFRDQSMEVINERPHPSGTALHTSVTLPVLGSLPSVALSPGKVWREYRVKFYFSSNLLLKRGVSDFGKREF